MKTVKELEDIERQMYLDWGQIMLDWDRKFAEINRQISQAMILEEVGEYRNV